MNRIPILLILSLSVTAARGQDWHPWQLVPPVEPTLFGPAPLRFGNSVSSVLVSPDGRTLVARAYSEWRAWNLQTGKPIGPKGQSFYASNVMFGTDPRSLIASLSGLGIVTLDLTTGDGVPVFESDPQDRLTLLGASRDGKRVLLNMGSGNRYYESRSRRGASDVWYAVRETATGKFLARVFDADEPLRAAVLSPDGKWLATVGSQGSIKLWDATSGKDVRTVRGPHVPANPSRRTSNYPAAVHFGFSPDSSLLAVANSSTNQAVSVWSVSDGARVLWWDNAAGGPCGPFTFSPDGRSVYAAGLHDPGTVRQYFLSTGAAGRPFRGHVGPVRSLTLSPDGRTLITGGDDGTVRVWDVARGEERFPHLGHIGEVDLLAFGRNGTWFASGGIDGTVRIRDPHSGAELIPPLPVTGGAVTALAAESVGTRLAIGYASGAIRTWDWMTGDVLVLQVPSAGGAAINRIRFDPDGRGISAVDAQTRFARWLLPSAAAVAIPAAPTEDESPAQILPGPAPLSLGVVQRNNRQKFVIRDVLTGKVRAEKQFAERESLYNPDLSPDGRWVVGSTEWNYGVRSVQFRDTDSLTERFALPVYDYGDRTSSRFTPDGRFALLIDSSSKPCAVEIASGELIARLNADEFAVTHMILSPDASRAVAVRSDGLFATYQLRPRAAPTQHSDTDLLKAWDDLASADPRVGLPAADRLATDPARSVPFLRDRLRPPDPVGEAEWNKLMADLDGPRFTTRAAAAARLSEVAANRGESLRKVLRETKSAEVRQTVERILKDATDQKYRPRGESLRHVRAVYALEWAGTKDAAALLRELSAGAPGSLLAAEATAAVARMR